MKFEMPEAVWLGRLSHEQAMAEMSRLQRERIEGRCNDLVLYLEHEPVVTYGRKTDRHDLHRLPHTMPTIEVSRGGQATYHGPGQMIGYCIIDLSRREGGEPDIHVFLRTIEQAIITFAAGHFSLRAVRRDGHTGVWVEGADPPRKLASIGLSARRWVTSHGFALNICTDLRAFDSIVPCGEMSAEATSIERELAMRGEGFVGHSVEALVPVMHARLQEALREAGWCREALV